MLSRPPHHRSACATRCIVRIDVHRSKDRAKDASSERRRRSLVLASSAYALWRMLTAFPSSATSGHPLSSARRLPRGIPAIVRRTDRGLRSDGTPRRVTPSRRPGCLSPPRHAKECEREGIAPSGLRAGSLAHAAHTLSPRGQVLVDWALRGHGAVTRRSVTFESADTFLTRWNCRAWD